MIELKVRKFGNSLGVVLPKEVINRLHAGEGHPLFLIEAPDGSSLITPYDPTFEKKMEKSEDISVVTATRYMFWLSESTRLDSKA